MLIFAGVKNVVYILLLAVLLGMLSCREERSVKERTLPVEQFADGDLAFRRGIGVMSRVVLVADGGGIYSHVGIVKWVGGVCCVVHAVPGEPEYKGDLDRVKVEPLTRFFASDRAARGEVMRMEVDSLVAARAAVQALQIARRGALFDHAYDLADTTAWYCTELVDWVYRQAGVDLSEGRLSRVSVPGVGGVYLLPSDLSCNRRLHSVYHFSR